MWKTDSTQGILSQEATTPNQIDRWRLEFGHVLSRESTIYWLGILVRVNVLSTGINVNGMISQDDQKVETQVIDPEILSKI